MNFRRARSTRAVALADHSGDSARLAVANQPELDLLADAQQADRIAQFGSVRLTDVMTIESRFKVNVLLVPNRHLETPNYEIERLRHDDLNNSEPLPLSFDLVKQPEQEDAARQAKEEAGAPRQEAVVKGITPAQPVWSIMRFASAGERTSPLPMTGMRFTAATTSAMPSSRASPEKRISVVRPCTVTAAAPSSSSRAAR